MGLRGVYGGGLGGGEGGSGEGWVRTQRGARLWFAGAACGYFFSAAASATSARDERCVHPGWRRGVGNEPWRGGRCAAPRRPAGGGGTRAPQRMSSLHILSATCKSAFFLRRCCGSSYWFSRFSGGYPLVALGSEFASSATREPPRTGKTEEKTGGERKRKMANRRRKTCTSNRTLIVHKQRN